MTEKRWIKIIINLKEEEFYELVNKLDKLKALYTRNKFISGQGNILNIEKSTEKISVS